MADTRCPNCSAPIKHYINSDGSSTDYCEYCQYRRDYPAPEKPIKQQLFGLVSNFVSDEFGVEISPRPKKSAIELMDEEKERERANEALKASMTDKQRRRFEKDEARRKAIEARRQEAYARAKRQKVFDPETGQYRYQ